MVAGVVAPKALETGIDQRIYLHGITWTQLEAFLEMRGDAAGVRIKYLKGDLELMSPSKGHEGTKTCFARLLYVFAEERDIELEGFGAWTLKGEPRAAEPDECYVLGAAEDAERPDIAIEVIWTSGGLDKLEIYRGLSVREVWFWQEGRITIWGLRGDRYERLERSELLPDLDVELLSRFVGMPQSRAVREYRAALRAARKP